MSDAFIGEFPYVDFFHITAGGFPSKWQRTPMSKIPALMADAKGVDCYYSAQHFAKDSSPATADETELHYCGPYADFDADDILDSQRDVHKLISFCREELDLDDAEMRIWFSGKKGFHVLFSPTAFGVTPDADLTYYYKQMFGHLKAFLDMPTLDMSVYTKRRMWRIPGSRHSATGLYKIELDHDDITLHPDSIRELAVSPRSRLVSHEDHTARSMRAATEFLAKFAEEYEAERAAAAHAPTVLHLDAAAEGDPVCVQDIETNGLKKPGDRNKGTVVLASYYKDVGRDQATANAALTKWALGLPPEHRRSDDRYIAANTKSVVQAVYEGGGYHFACNFIRSLHGPKTTPDYERVPCAGESCPFIAARAADDEPPTRVHLAEIGRPELVGKPVTVTIRVAGRTEASYLIPGTIEVRAMTDECERGHCSVHSAGGKMTRDFRKDKRVLIAMCNVPDQQRDALIRKEIEKSSCKRFAYSVTDSVRVVEIMAIPKAETTFGKGRSAAGQYTYQRAYALDTDVDFRVNAYYEVAGTVYPHPKSQAATLAITGATPIQDEIETFDLAAATPHFAAFAGSDAERLSALVADMSVNVVKVAGRASALLAMLLTVNAPLTLSLQGERYGGWVQTVIVGDTGEAKSQMVERFMEHVGLGELVSAQSSGRTGLLYTIINKDTTHNFIQWGSFVLNDRGLLVIDEASGMDRDAYAELRNARRDGIFKVSRSVTGEANSRARLLVLSNPRFGKNMNDFRHGVEALVKLFEAADIRRFDLAVGFRSGSVTHEQIEHEMAAVVEHKFTPETMRANMLWAWSRTPEQIVWEPEVLPAVKEATRRLNERYEGSDIHLLSQDAVEKVARMSQALAATLHSTNDDHTQLIVKEVHVSFVEQLIESLYASPDLEFDYYVKQQREDREVDYNAVFDRIRMAFERTHYVDLVEVFDLFQRNAVVSPFAMECVAGDPKTGRAVMRDLYRSGLVKQGGRGGIEKTNTFIELLRRWEHSRSEDVA